jgi:glycosyltransferase involved in cell wall biosynthesis
MCGKMSIRQPWLVRKFKHELKNRIAYYSARLGQFFSSKTTVRKSDVAICFVCGFHGSAGAVSGAIPAIASIANLLSEVFPVGFVTYPLSNFNQYLGPSVHFLPELDENADLYICDLSCDRSVLETLKKNNKKIIVSCHGLLHSESGLGPDEKISVIAYADMVHFVSEAQAAGYALASERFRVIPNFVQKVRKTRLTNNAGVVGNLDNPGKNIHASVRVFQYSNADQIHLWGLENESFADPNVVLHSWQKNKRKIYDSFDVLVFLSREETQGLVVVEAMSAGIPCLLSDIPAFRQYLDCNGIKIADLDNIQKSAGMLDGLLKDKMALKPGLIEFWKKNYSRFAVKSAWHEMINEVARD